MRVYIAGPLRGTFSNDDKLVNVHTALRAADVVMRLGHSPFVPHLCYYWNQLSPKDASEWLAWDFEWLTTCHVLLRLPGESRGADMEVDLARQLKIPVVFGIDEFSLMCEQSNI